MKVSIDEEDAEAFVSGERKRREISHFQGFSVRGIMQIAPEH